MSENNQTTQPQQTNAQANPSVPPAIPNTKAVPPSEPAQPQQAQAQSADDSIIAQLQAQNAALMAQNEQLNAQVIKMINSGAQLNSSQPPAQAPQPAQPAHVTQAQQLQSMGMQMQPENQFNPHSLSSLPDLSLEGLAGEIGKDRPKH